MIDGVKINRLRVIPDERGWVTELLRSDDEVFKKFGQVYLTALYPGIVKAWHYHKKQTDNFACVKGMIKVVLYDARKDSKTCKEINEFFIGDNNQLLISVPPGVYHGFKAVSEETAYVINVPSELYHYEKPDEFRLPPDSKEIPYDWILTPGKKHG